MAMASPEELEELGEDTEEAAETGEAEGSTEEALEAEVKALRKRIKAARAEAADTDFVDMTETIRELGHIKFKIRRKFRGHVAKVTDVHWSDDSQMLLTAGQDGYLIVWDALSGNKLNAMQLKVSWVMACAVAPSSAGLMVASGGLDDICSVFDLRSRDGEARLSVELTGHTGYVSGVRFVRDDAVLTASCDNTCCLWNVERGRSERTFEGHTEGINGLAVPDEQAGDVRVFLTGSSDLSCRLWDVREPGPVRWFEGGEQDINGVTYFPQHEYGFVTAAENGACCLWDIRADQMVAEYMDEYIQCGATSVALSKSGRLLIAGYDDFNCHVWDVLREERVGIMPAHDGRISRVIVSPNGLAVATGSWDNRCFIWTAK